LHADILYRPSRRMVSQYGSDAFRHAQDGTLAHSSGDLTVAAVVDGARNFLGQTDWPADAIAAARGLHPGIPLNGGEIASSLLLDGIKARPELIGAGLVRHLNLELSLFYAANGIAPGNRDPGWRGHLFTAYTAVIQVSRQAVTVTGIGDCYAALDGQTVTGHEKLVDRLYGDLVDACAAATGRHRQRVYQAVMPSLNERQFWYQNQLPSAGDIADFYAWIPGVLSAKLGLPPAQAEPMLEAVCHDLKHGSLTTLNPAYGAVDGTRTLGSSITVHRREHQPQSAVLWTDGLRPRRGLAVTDLSCLVPTDEEYGEQAAIWLRDFSAPGLTIRHIA
jgi:hypothetical protein